MVNTSKNSINPKSIKPAKAADKPRLPRQKYQNKQNAFQQRKFSIIDSDSSSLSEYESEEEHEEDSNGRHIGLPRPKNKVGRPRKVKDYNTFSGKFQAIQSESEDDDEEDEDDDEEEEEEEHLWKTNANRVVNTSSEDEEEDDSSSSDDENVDFVKLTAERKKRALESYRSSSPFLATSPKKDNSDDRENSNNNLHSGQEDVDFSFEFNGNDHQLKISQEEEDVGEELSGFSPVKEDRVVSLGNEPLGFMNIDESSESDGEINRDELLRTLEQDSDDGIDTGIETGDDELSILKHEADMIAQDYDQDGLQLSSNNATRRNSVVENLIRQHKSEMQNNDVLQFVSDDEYDESHDEYDEDDEFDADDALMIPFFDDSVFKEQLHLNNQSINNYQSTQNKNEQDLDSDDDSYLWDYFFSSGEEDNNNEDNNNNNQPSQYSDDETTDEDVALPPPSSRKNIGAKAQELLSSSSVAVRPPALGTWSTDSKPFGIIDGLSTRSLLPNHATSKHSPPSNNGSSHANSTGLNNNNSQHNTTLTNRSNSPPITGHIEEFALDELLNMSELEDEEGDDLNHETWLEVTNNNRNVPLSAFRNKGVVNDQDSHINATRRFSSSQNNNTVSKFNRRRYSTLDAALEKKKTPKIRFNENSLNKKVSKNRRNSTKMRRRQSIAEAAVEGLRVTKSGLFSEDTLNNVEEFLNGLGNETELSILFREVQ